MSQVAMVPKTVTHTQPYSDGDTDLNSDSEQENTPPAKRPRALAETVTCKYTSLQQSLSTHQCDTPLTATGTGNRPAKTKALSSASKGHPSHIDRQWLTDGFKFGCTWGRGLAGPPASHTFQRIWSDNIGSAEIDKCPILSDRLISAEISDNIGWAEIYLYSI